MNEPTPGPGPHPSPRRPLAVPPGTSPARTEPCERAAPPVPRAAAEPDIAVPPAEPRTTAPHAESRADASPSTEGFGPGRSPAGDGGTTGDREGGADGLADVDTPPQDASVRDDGPQPLGLRVEPTGHPPVDAQLRRLEDADHLAVSGHLEVYEDVHRGLRDTLTALDRHDPHHPRS